MKPIVGLALVLCLGCAKGPPRPAAFPVPGAPSAEAIGPVTDPAPSKPEAAEADRWQNALRDRDIRVRLQAAEMLGDLGEIGFPSLLEGLQSEMAEVRLACLRSVKRQVLAAHGDEVVPVLARLLADADTLVRREAIGRVSGLGDQTKALLPELRNVAGADPDREIRDQAANALIDVDSSVPSLVRLLKDSVPAVRKQAALHVAGLEGDAEAVLPSLQRMAASDPDPDVRITAEKGLRRLSRQP